MTPLIKNLSNRIKLEHDKQAKSVKDGGSIVSIVLEIQKEKIMRFLLILSMR